MKTPQIKTLRIFMLSVCFSVTTASAQPPDDAQRRFDAAIQKRDSGMIFEAIQLFESILNTQPGLNRARLELAVAYHRASRYEDALHEFKIVLDDPNTPESVRLSILAYLGQLTSDKLKPDDYHHFSYYAKAGLIHNSNINVTPGKGEILFPNRADTSLGEISSAGIDVSVSASHRYSQKKPIDIAGVATHFEWQSQASLTGNIYEKTGDYDLYVATISTGPAFISPGRWRSLIDVRFDQILLDSSTLTTDFSVNPVITFDFGGFHSMSLEATLKNHNYAEAADAGRDGIERMIGVGYTTIIDRTGLEAGFRLNDNSADVAEFAYTSQEIYLGGFITTPLDSNVYLKLSTRAFEYGGPDSTIPTIIRDDKENHFALGYNQDFINPLLQHWSLNAELSVTNNRSNINAFDYERTMLTINLSRYFQ